LVTRSVVGAYASAGLRLSAAIRSIAGGGGARVLRLDRQVQPFEGVEIHEADDRPIRVSVLQIGVDYGGPGDMQ
jgi:hypothetical protein